MGNEVYLFAPKGSSSAKIINYQHNSVSPKEIAEFVKRNLPPDIDIIHDHTHASVVGRLNLDIPTICTIHTPVNNPVKYPYMLKVPARFTLEVMEAMFIMALTQMILNIARKR